MDNSWAFGLETEIFSIVKTRITRKIGSRYPTLFVTNVGKNTTGATFPCIYIREIGGVEAGKDLERTGINAVAETIQVDVTTNTKQSEAKNILAEVAVIFKKMAFEIVSMPEFNENEEVFRSTARFRRTISATDILM